MMATADFILLSIILMLKAAFRELMTVRCKAFVVHEEDLRPTSSTPGKYVCGTKLNIMFVTHIEEIHPTGSAGIMHDHARTEAMGKCPSLIKTSWKDTHVYVSFDR